MKRQPERHEIAIDFDGKNHTGTYIIQSKMVTVSCLYGGPVSTQIGGMTAEILAKMLLREILQGAKSRGDI